nr:Chain A, ILE-HIS-VAL-HIS-LEU-GLN-ILE [synthetic construct]5UGK_C Chain C, ILE-HIS-VAL-HIS-LEU-GLN-ILE [synthetic construct]5UGK_E Chain E, ILE-HIS-VAL-HIS-LEU-GLN-ILE [synthetic construct]5UGK_G Chain G, ILE-HIS-VAL-HIS-LEU-GLN-ILE [synthetic construct]5UGK_I Chain I, ILE-HIS-VAL-HIS-LEU-GLN-ILE [synthetic construct]5UGK_K Chain K, ILE-HIS-VAL-HIS-LEU-GLN-ILE [synthetic construct]5UGK_O Chain O, ILE-HIS-VAL-HIS-LEU-GLN-ILE [synthetic construct]5UGK_Q Chain Q, ILE-HIS-VAL-HIS-LEU-GLN-ILE [
IHVHLQI